MKKIRYFLEAVLLHSLFILFRLLGPRRASDFGGWLGRSIGPRLAASRKAMRNLENALPALTPAQAKESIADMWENLGRVVAEYPHLESIIRDNVEIEGLDILKRAIESGKGAVCFSGHLGNWEINAPYLALMHDVPGSITYRAPNNPWTDRLLVRARTLNGRIKALPKERSSGKHLLQTLKNKEFIGILIDQKYNEGLAVPFFGQEAMTNPVFVQLAQKFECPLIPVRCERIGGTRFRLTFHEPLDLAGDTEDVIARAHRNLESWITARPGQWLWLHRRWG